MTDNKTAVVFNYDDLISRLDGRELATYVLNIFLNDMPSQIQKLVTAHKTGNVQLLIDQSHKIRGACANVSADSLCQIIKNIEIAATNNDLINIEGLIDEFESHFEKIKLVMNEAYSTENVGC